MSRPRRERWPLSYNLPDDRAATAYRAALDLVGNERERIFLRRRLAEVSSSTLKVELRTGHWVLCTGGCEPSACE
jgi:hypothetical protein